MQFLQKFIFIHVNGMTHYCHITYTHIMEYVPLKYQDFAIIIGCDLLTLVVWTKQKAYNRLSRIAVYPQSALLCPHLSRIVQGRHYGMAQATFQPINAAYHAAYVR